MQSCRSFHNCRQLSHMQPAAGRGQSAGSLSHCGNYRGAAHSRCNLKYGISTSEWKLPVVMHNLKRTAPGLAWDAARKMTHLSLERITNIDMYHFVENSVRGGISMIITRYAQANSPTLPGYDASRPHCHLI